ncbi:hypothetical protein M422DRAFT_178936, partial [Sphaerobolus stellatus SS14]
ACNLQGCLNKNKFDPDKCQHLMRNLYTCCDRMYSQDPNAESSACPIRSAVTRWLDRHPDAA